MSASPRMEGAVPSDVMVSLAICTTRRSTCPGKTRRVLGDDKTLVEAPSKGPVGWKRGDKPVGGSDGKVEKVVLTIEWQRHEIDVSGKDLTRIKTGLVWTLPSPGQPVTFYLDDIRWA